MENLDVLRSPAGRNPDVYAGPMRDPVRVTPGGSLGTSDLAFVPVISVVAVRHVRQVGGHFLATEFAALVWEPTDLHELIVIRPTPHLLVRILGEKTEG